MMNNFPHKKPIFLQNNITDYVPINEKLVVKQVDDLPEPSLLCDFACLPVKADFF